MITIIEDTPSKISGVTSLYIRFSYNQEVINTIKLCSKYSYNKQTFTWEVPITSLAFLLDNLTYLDDIQLYLKKEDDKKEMLLPIIKHNIPPFKHQTEAIEFGLNNSNWLLLDAPGLGKTLTMIYLAEELKKQAGLKHCLIICGINTLKLNWQKEIKKYSNLSCRVLGQKISKKGKYSYASISDRAKEILEPLEDFFLITNVETLRSNDIIDALKKSKNKFDMVVIDEIHKCSNVTSNQGHNLLKLKEHRFKIGLTGTLLTNRPLDAYLPLKWIGKEKATLTDFKGQYCNYGGFGGHQIIGYKNLDILKNEIDSCSLRRTKEMVLKDLPPKTIIKEIVEMNDDHRKFYENVRDGVKEECDKITLKSQDVLALTVRLRQATASPSTLTSNDVSSSKVDRAVDLCDEIITNGDKVVIMSTFKDPVNVLAERLKEYHPLLGTGDMRDEDVSKNIDLFQTDDIHKVFICTTSKCGTGITLNRASYMIMLDTPWTASLTEQCEDRIHRIGSQKPVFIYRLICQGTIDEVVDKIVETKKAISDYMIDDNVSENTLSVLRDYIQDL